MQVSFIFTNSRDKAQRPNYLASSPHISREELPREKKGQGLYPELANRKRVLVSCVDQSEASIVVT